MEIILEEKVKQYILDKEQKNITVNNVPTKCCCGSMCLPSVQFGVPKDRSKYDLYNVDGEINVYIHKTIQAKNNQLILNLRNFILFKDIAVEGVKVL